MIDTHLINSLVALAYNNLKEENVVYYKKVMDPQLFRQEFGTVRIQLPRGLGHTTEGVNLLMGYPGSVMVVETEIQRKQIAHQERNKHILYRIVTFPENRQELMRFQAGYTIPTGPAPLLIIDTYTRIVNLKVDQLYSLLEIANPHYELFVLLE